MPRTPQFIALLSVTTHRLTVLGCLRIFFLRSRKLIVLFSLNSPEGGSKPDLPEFGFVLTEGYFSRVCMVLVLAITAFYTKVHQTCFRFVVFRMSNNTVFVK